MELGLVVQFVVVKNSLLKAIVRMSAAAGHLHATVQQGAVFEEECLEVEARCQIFVVLVCQLMMLLELLAVLPLEPHLLVGSSQVELAEGSTEVTAHMFDNKRDDAHEAARLGNHTQYSVHFSSCLFYLVVDADHESLDEATFFGALFELKGIMIFEKPPRRADVCKIVRSGAAPCPWIVSCLQCLMLVENFA